MKVVILCGGKGTRLREETEFRPKPMLPIGDRPILWHIMKIYAAQGHKDFVLCLGYKGEIIKEFFCNYLWQATDVSLHLGRAPKVRFHSHHDEEDWNVTVAETGPETLTAGRIKRIERYIGDDETFLMTYGDGVGRVDVNKAIASHQQQGKTLTVTAVHPPGRFGELGLGNDNAIRTFNEKPQSELGWIHGGYFVASRKLFSYLENSDQTMLEQEPMRRLAAEGNLNAYRHEGFWQPMDTFQEFTYLNRLWSDNEAPWRIW